MAKNIFAKRQIYCSALLYEQKQKHHWAYLFYLHFILIYFIAHKANIFIEDHISAPPQHNQFLI